MALAINSDISNELWQSALDTLERTFSKPVFEMWIKPIRFISFHGNELHLAVHSKFAQDWVGTKLRAQMIGVFSELFGTSVELRLSVAEPNEGTRARRPAFRHVRLRSSVLQILMLVILSKSLSSAIPTALHMPRRKRSPALRLMRIIRSSSTEASVSARRT